MKGKRIIQSVCIFQVCLMTMTAFAAADVRSDRTETMKKITLLLWVPNA